MTLRSEVEGQGDLRSGESIGVVSVEYVLLRRGRTLYGSRTLFDVYHLCTSFVFWASPTSDGNHDVANAYSTLSTRSILPFATKRFALIVY